MNEKTKEIFSDLFKEIDALAETIQNNTNGLVYEYEQIQYHIEQILDEDSCETIDLKICYLALAHLEQQIRTIAATTTEAELTVTKLDALYKAKMRMYEEQPDAEGNDLPF